jgi:broad specificity phosphatase PhoE
MSPTLPQIYLIRHGETEWSLSGRHTGRTDLPLTPRGEQQAIQIGKRLQSVPFVGILTSPLQRARRTCELAALDPTLVIDPDLAEWDYGDYEGRRTAEIQSERPGWNLFREGCPNGETLERVSARADRIVARLRKADGDMAVFSHGHFLRVLAVRWLALPSIEGRRFLLKTATVSILGYEHHNLGDPAVVLWNDGHHLMR